MFGVEGDDGQLFPRFQPMVARHQAVMFVCLAVPLFPAMEFAGTDADPLHQLFGGQFGPLLPLGNVVDDFVAYIRGNPSSFQSSPLASFALTFSSINSEITSFLLISLA